MPLQNPLALTALTLRGIGSYAYGTRLDIRPLTVLCGTNGSGKSTWLKVLNVLRKSLEANKLPFGFDITDWAPNNVELMNAFYHLSDPEAHARLESPEATQNFGPPGTIGLEFKAVCDFGTNEPSFTDASEVQNLAQQILWLGTWPKGTRFRIWLAHPSYWLDDQDTPHLRDVVELTINDSLRISMTSDRDSFKRFEPGRSRPRITKPYELQCSSEFLPTPKDAPSEWLTLATITNLASFRCTAHLSEVPEDFVEGIVDAFERRLLVLLRMILDSYFFIGAVRTPHTYLSLDELKTANQESDLHRRYVGPSGENAWLLERRFAQAHMRQRDLGRFNPAAVRGKACLELFEDKSRNRDNRLEYLWQHASDATKHEVGQLFDVDVEEGQAARCVSELLNSILDRRDLFTDSPWIDEFNWDDELDEFITRGAQAVEARDVARINYLMIELALQFQKDGSLRKGTRFEGTDIVGYDERGLLSECSYSLDSYVSAWVGKLTGVGIHYHLAEAFRTGQWSRYFPADGWLPPKIELPCGFIFQKQEHWAKRDLMDERSVTRMIHPCFGEGDLCSVQPPRQISSGFHQIFPLIVQLGLMKEYEFVGIENPEVHLHPGLQLQVAEMLVVHASTSRCIFVETHSDLLVRRVIRALLEETLPQSNVQIYFTDLHPSPDLVVRVKQDERAREVRFKTSRLRPISVDERGRISNWPAGFLDDDVQESQRLMDIMYGRGDKEEDDG